jgi:hypothetical protein
MGPTCTTIKVAGMPEKGNSSGYFYDFVRNSLAGYVYGNTKCHL